MQVVHYVDTMKKSKAMSNKEMCLRFEVVENEMDLYKDFIWLEDMMNENRKKREDDCVNERPLESNAQLRRACWDFSELSSATASDGEGEAGWSSLARCLARVPDHLINGLVQLTNLLKWVINFNMQPHKRAVQMRTIIGGGNGGTNLSHLFQFAADQFSDAGALLSVQHIHYSFYRLNQEKCCAKVKEDIGVAPPLDFAAGVPRTMILASGKLRHLGRRCALPIHTV
ncbi:hypothetical protein LXL04_014214 [Taraxacum kok-saghyz]